jgi:hypothetical protein
MKIPIGTLVLVTWDDITGDDGWQDVKKAAEQKPCLFVSVGWLLKNSPALVVITSAYSPEDETVGGVTAIPRGVVRSIKPLRGHMKPIQTCACKRSP